MLLPATQLLQFRCCMPWLSHRALAQATIHCDITPLASQLVSLQHENAAHAHIASTVPIRCKGLVLLHTVCSPRPADDASAPRK
jgi:hypothetical protein